MNWLTNFVRPKIRALVAPPDTADTLWHKCPNCEAMIFHRDLTANNHVCQHCGHHMRLAVDDRLAMLFDDGKYETIDLPKPPADPLRFRDSKRYTDRLREAQSRSGRNDAIVVAHGEMGGTKTVIAAFDFGFLGGSMGTAVGAGFVAGARLATLQKAAFIAIPASGGARMHEGMLSLMQMPRTVIAVEMVKEAGLPYIVLLTDPTTGGVSASFAMLGDVHVAERGAQIGFAGARVIEETIRESLPEGFQRAEYLLEHGMVDIVAHRNDLRVTLIRLIDLLMHRTPPAEIVPIDAAKAGDSEEPAKLADETAEGDETTEDSAEETAPEHSAEEREPEERPVAE